MDAPVGALFAAALCVILLPCAANSRVQRGLALALLCGALTTVKEIGTVFALCVVGIWFLQCLLDALRDKGGILRGFLLPFTAALPCFAIPLAWKLLLKALHRADDQFSSMGPGYFCSAGKRPVPVLTATFTMCGTATMPGCAAIRCCLGPAPSRWAVCALRPQCCF